MNEPLPRPRIITLTTDFGLADHYLGTMKGVLLTHCPGATLVDITHQIPQFSVTAGAYAIAQAWSFFPPGTVHLIVVDPGVGTSRRAVIAEASGHLFVAPDNGVLGMVLFGRSFRTVEITKPPSLPYPTSQTFHGRDVFAVVAGQLAAGSVSPNHFGTAITDLCIGFAFEEISTENGWQGLVLSIDQFGNVITNFSAQRHSELPSTHFVIEGDQGGVQAFYRTFGEAPPETPFAYFGSSGFVEIGMNRGSAARVLNVEVGDPLVLVQS